MAVQQNKKSRSRRDMRRSHDALTTAAVSLGSGGVGHVIFGLVRSPWIRRIREKNPCPIIAGGNASEKFVGVLPARIETVGLGMLSLLLVLYLTS